jgi:hypothetical protein
VRRIAENNVNWQERATEYSVGDRVVPYGMFEDQVGRVTAVWPAIGMVDVETSVGNKRYPVEDLQRFDKDGEATPPTTDSAPGGQPTVSVPGGPYPRSASRVAAAYAKKAIYWVGKDRQYRMNKQEKASGTPCCPRCAGAPLLKKAIYKRREGASDRLMGCPGCMFLIKESDLTEGAGI